MQIISQFGAFINKSNHKNTFRTKLDGISSKLIANQSGIP
jgi:hypothetical protein